ncbi:hypothetical protein H6H00_28625 [Pseudonocardia petroleophila]|uniref:Uncharacterized protein n=1 Tax=Pseudonocardia petroleophila TaxID=37331 RepID=A0A7G7MT04_9PSEU|nr:hypothetical protein H6H00_28625 [Pseudonocardia petroleophila]
MEVQVPTSEPVVSPCWCCAGEFAEVDLVRLGARPEAAVCLDCARFVKRRAVARRDEHRWTPFGAVRGGVQWVRDRVISNGWHERGPLGAFLRRLDRFLP